MRQAANCSLAYLPACLVRGFASGGIKNWGKLLSTCQRADPIRMPEKEAAFALAEIGEANPTGGYFDNENGV